MKDDAGEMLVTIKIKASVRDKLRNMGTKSDTYSSLLERYSGVIRIPIGNVQVMRLDDETFCLVAKVEHYEDLLEILEHELNRMKLELES